MDEIEKLINDRVKEDFISFYIDDADLKTIPNDKIVKVINYFIKNKWLYSSKLKRTILNKKLNDLPHYNHKRTIYYFVSDINKHPNKNEIIEYLIIAGFKKVKSNWKDYSKNKTIYKMDTIN